MELMKAISLVTESVSPSVRLSPPFSTVYV